MTRAPPIDDAAAGVCARRLAAQQVARHDFSTPEALVGWLGAVQAQDYAGSKWALAVRLRGRETDASVGRALDEGRVIRTHALRGTWQLIAPDDARWMISLVGPRIMARAEPRHAQLDLESATVRRAVAAIDKALGGGAALTRQEIAAALSRARISPAGQRLSHLLACAELDAAICNGPRRGKQATWVQFDRAVRAAKPVRREEAAGRLASRYFQSRGPATLRDFVWWSGLPVAEARAGIEALAGELASETIAGQRHWHSGQAARRSIGRAVFLLPPFDEYLVGYRDRDMLLDPAHAKLVNAGGGLLDASIVVGGRVVGTWRRTLARERVSIVLRPFHPLSRADGDAVRRAATSYAEFLGLRADVSTASCR